jgi:hypothetical protein
VTDSDTAGEESAGGLHLNRIPGKRGLLTRLLIKWRLPRQTSLKSQPPVHCWASVPLDVPLTSCGEVVLR